MSKYIIALAMTMLPFTPISNIENDKAYILGFEDGSKAMTNAINAQMCLSHYKEIGENPGPECFKFYENAKLIMAKYERIKGKVETLKKDKKNKKDKK